MRQIVKLLMTLFLVTPLSCAKISLSQQELQYIKNHTFKCVATGTWEPFNVLSDKKLVGIAVDYWELIKKSLGLKTNCLVADNFNEVLKDIKSKKADLNFATGKTSDREKYAVFSKPYLSFPIVMATNNSVGFISDISLIKDKIIAVGKNYTADILLKKNYPDMHIVETKNVDEALRLVSQGKAFAAIDILPVISYKINKYSFTDLKISGNTPWNFDVRIMVRKDMKKLLPLLNRAIDSIEPSKKEQIYQKWLSVKHKKSRDKRIIFVLLVILLLLVGWALHLTREIKKRKILEAELERLATMDKLTSIYNRYKLDVSLDEQVEIARRYGRDLSIIFFDIDFFKDVNDRYGHRVGDEVLKELTQFVSNLLRKSDIFGRWGGEEFLIILPETSKKEATMLAEKLRNAIEHHDFKHIKRLTCSFGVASFKKGDTSESIISRVDKRLYSAKESGRNRVESK